MIKPEFNISPHARDSEAGFSLVSVIMTLGFTLITGLALSQWIVNITLAQEAQVTRWEAQLVAESVTDVVASLTPDELYGLLESGSNPVSLGSFYTKSEQPWLAEWERPNFIGSISFRVQLFDANGLESNDLPAVRDRVREYDRQITTRLQFIRKKGSKPETLEWVKWISREG